MWVTFQLQASAVRVMIALAFFGFGVRCAKLSAQNDLWLSHYTTQDGLPDGTIGCITQDSYGFMWFGTDDGLCRFDGNEFLVFRRGEKNKSICGNNISSLKLSKKTMDWHFRRRNMLPRSFNQSIPMVRRSHKWVYFKKCNVH